MTDVNEIRSQWVADLRSGYYKQGRGGFLNKNGKFCCLGVLAEQLANKNLIESTKNYTTGGTCYGYQRSFNFPDGEIRNMADLSYGEAWVLVDMNDSQAKSFVEIADYLEGVFNES